MNPSGLPRLREVFDAWSSIDADPEFASASPPLPLPRSHSASFSTAGTPEALEAPGGFTSRERQVTFAERMNSLPKTVYSRTLTRAAWGPATVTREVVAEDVAAWKRRPGKALVLFAGAGLASTFIELDLVDEYRLMIHPLLLGQGLPLFGDLSEERALSLARTETFSSGVVLLQYDRDRAAG